MSALEWAETLTFSAALLVLGYYAYILLFNRGIPNVKTAPAIRGKIIETLIADQAANKHAGPYRIYDLGAGSGRFTREIARALPQAGVTGIEISRWPFLRAVIAAKLLRLSNLDYRRQDLHAADLADADAVVFYLSAHFMPEIRKTLEDKLKPGTLVISNKFPLGGTWRPEATHGIRTRHPRQGEVFIYRS